MDKSINNITYLPSIQTCSNNSECKQAGCGSCRSYNNVEDNLLKMDSLYGASFTPWLKNEENVMVTATYLQRVCNEYCFPRIVTAIKWLEKGWKADSTAWLIKHITQHWGTGNHCSNDKIDIARATFIQCLMEHWSKQKKAEFVPIFLDLTYPNSSQRRITFLKTLFEKMNFTELTELFSIMGSGLDYSTKVVILQLAAGRNNKLKVKRTQVDINIEENTKKSKCFNSNNSLGLIMNNQEFNNNNNNNINNNNNSDNINNLEDIFESVNTPTLNNISLVDNSNSIRNNYRALRLTRANTDDNRVNLEFNSNINEDRTSRTCPGTPASELNLTEDDSINSNNMDFYINVAEVSQEVESGSHLSNQELSVKIRANCL